MAGYRPQRVAEMIHRELSVRLRDELKDPSFTPVSITHVEVSRDLGSARVSWTPLGGDPPSNELVEAVEAAARRLRGPIGRALRLRHAPDLRFELDVHTDNAVRLTALLGEIGRELDGRDVEDDSLETEGEE
ncbi:MAG: 30S ribosome-binding factor RbfA, partial [Myxococcota bacterium]